MMLQQTTTRPCAICGAAVTRPSSRFRHPPERTVCGPHCAAILRNGLRVYASRNGCERLDGVERRRKIMDYIVAYKRQHDGLSPSTREIAGACGLSSKSTVFVHLKTLEREGKIALARRGGIMVAGGRWSIGQAGR